MDKRLFIVDGHALIFKMYYAFLGNPIVNSKGEDMSILFGFTKYLLELIEKESPSHIAVCFDPPGGSFRNQLYPDYKANRVETPRLIIDALEPLKQIVEAMNIPVLMMPGFEADDVIGSAAVRFEAEGFNVYMVTPDKDFGQLITEHILQYKPAKGRGDNEILGPNEVCEKWGIKRAAQVVDVLAICGDASDNVPGVQGVGPKGASKLLDKYDSLENIYAHLSELTPRQKELFLAAQDHISLSKELVTIKTDISLSVSASDMLFDMRYTSVLAELMNRFELPSIKRMISKITQTANPINIEGEKTAKAFVPEGREIRSLQAGRVALNLVNGVLYLCAGSEYCCGALVEFKQILEDESVVKVGYALKNVLNYAASLSVDIQGRLEDIEILHYLINPESSHKLDSLVHNYLGVSLEDQTPVQTLSLFDEVPEIDSKANAVKQTLCLIPLADKLLDEITSQARDDEFPSLQDVSPSLRGDSRGNLYDSVEEPLIKVLSRMERAGVKVDMNALKEYAESLRKSLLEQEALVKELAGEPDLNIASPKQLGVVLFEKLKLDPNAKKPKNGSWSTDETTLRELSDRSPIIDAILEYRGLRKLLSTYIEPFGSFISPLDGRVHTTFNQALTATGRLSSSNPNLQNIPIRTEQGRQIRKAFVAGAADSLIMSADYSQIELRIMAHLCGDTHLINAFRSGEDIHAATASKIFKIDISEVSAEQRRVAKTANFGIMYGISAFGLSQRLNCSRSEAKQIIEDYFESFPLIREFIDRSIADARSLGYVQTLFSRRRYLPDIVSTNANIRSLAERNAVNAPIQGSAADIIKMAMIAVDNRLRREGLGARIVLQIHDELLLEVPENEIDKARSILVEEMENVVKLSVPLTVECNYGKNWLEAH